MNQEIIIDIDNLRARKVHSEEENHHFFLKDYASQIKRLIESRIKELNENKGFQEYFEYIMHDSILIYGTRGNGKTTIMMNLKEILQDKDEKILKKDIKILEIIDPTLLEEEEDFLLVILKSFYSEVIEYHASGISDTDKTNFEKQLEKILEQIEGTRVTEKRIEIFDKFYGNKSGVGLAKAIHKLFYTATKIFNVKTIILPIDDIDMNMHQGYKITESIRKYLASPYVIPVVSFNLKQMNAIARKNKYKAFGLDLINDDIEKYKDLDFLLSLPSDYLTAIFPPNRRIYLKSIYDILNKELNNNGNQIYLKSDKIEKIAKLLHKYTLSTDSSKEKQNTMNLRLILTLFLAIVYEKKLPDNLIGKKIDDYLTNRSIRDFLHDMSALISSLVYDKEKRILKSKQSTILARFSPENQNQFINEKQALVSLWYDFLELAKKNITKTDLTKKDIKNNWTRIITSISYDDHPELVNKKTYRRLWLQRYYYKDKITIDYKEEYSVNKNTSISGFLELCLRSYIPMFLFKEIISRHRIEYSFHDIMRLKEMATADLMDVAYHLSVMELFLKQHEYKSEDLRNNVKLFASIHVNYRKKELYMSQYNIPFLFKLRKQDLFFDDNHENSRQMYFFSIFKAMALFIVSLKIVENQTKKYGTIFEERKWSIFDKKLTISDYPYHPYYFKPLRKEVKNKFKKLFEQFRINLPCENSNNFVENFLEEYIKSGYFQQLIDLKTFPLKNSEFGIMECMRFSKRLIKFFYDIRANTNLEDNFSSLNFNVNSWEQDRDTSLYIISKPKNNEQEIIKGEGTLSQYFEFPLSAYFSGFSQSMLISLIDTQPDIKELDIYTINSIHGANLGILEEKKLAKQSNAFISNINYLLSFIEKKDDYKILHELEDGDTYSNDTNINDTKKIKEILSFYENFLNINFFKKLIDNYEVKKGTEKCDFKEDK